MSTNRPNPNQHQNRPQQNNQPQKPHLPLAVDEKSVQVVLSPEDAGKSFNFLAAKDLTEKDVKIEDNLFGRNTTLKELISNLVSAIVDEKITPNQARQYMHDWHKQLPEKTKEEFKLNRNAADETMNYFRGIMDTLAQELPYLYVA